MEADQDILKKLKDPVSRNFGFDLLVRKYQESIYSLNRKMVIDHDDADDITQEVFIKVWKNIRKFREDAQLSTWIYRIAINSCLSFLKKKRRKFLLPLHDVENELCKKIETSPDIDADSIQLKLQKALLTLPEKQRLVFNMKYFEEMKYEEIAEITQTSIGSLKASYHHAVKKIENYLGEH